MTTDRGHVTRVPILLRNRDMDTLGHLNQSLYHVFIEEARTAVVLELLGTGVVDYVLARVELDHLHEVRLEDREVAAEAWIEHVGAKSLRIGSRVVKLDGTVVAQGTTVLVAWDPERRGSRPIDDEERAALVAGLPVAT
ncbi:thioesterase family protein [Patulibacter sp.]|uniref:acyl-CoA thioesterase n=1 Tax=Patulibacter sp. TaxID=1912859 RepID=UPI002726D913|nr:hotdog domain-containing protein [Patulibacter sp.]MDO9410576.1 hotdog domain-containing protein [Patulibacter sp.]